MVRVKVEIDRVQFRLRWTFPKGVRNTLYIPGGCTAISENIAKSKATWIEREIINGTYDHTLERYQESSPKQTEDLTVIALMERFITVKSHETNPRGLQKYHATLARVQQYFSTTKRASEIDLETAAKFRDWLKTLKNSRGLPLSNVTIKERLQILSSCWSWAEDEKILKSNPWKRASRTIKKQKSQPKPLTPEEIPVVIATYQSDPYYSFYADLVKVLLGTGARFGEVACLTWDDLSEDCDRIHFHKSFSRGETSPTTKNDKTGWINIPNNLQAVLKRRKLSRCSDNPLVFPSSRQGSEISDQTFRESWIVILRKAKIEYRKPYSTRSTLISFWLSQGEDPATIAKMTRTSIKMIYEHYGASIKTNVVLPEIF
ncbi:integrase family protein [Leptolyngbya boryana NIES-2135]|jgi:integrase|uniref:Integrase family protein n=1 Tax=Leptolyngbya boryana NIES-2135 TaxID=1973484 RepID=A0A1Z4JI40_LEPBY|nr:MULTISPECIES: tyrosine-type recombinase/integrase [Leptolyngbya]BAY56396.1 integrase family protein [Leptolyngbya boryana NIES-2135]MBD2366502.1 tyrosine-type recombinase/integrase [Leptolyngbya sp. FACHB-161]MBD2372681.1 tyrosine-type recombinase/integrase [Leptolyngbya sp. FACHB-238]MBD2397104.1 tyrosine-type recombinase/integrase [Leptolyngbya sp. FACHB-239]MBD2403628.1 tyrosine-type recombinase/integrase [Leptolyngbya sp. FACHB-402]